MRQFYFLHKFPSSSPSLLEGYHVPHFRFVLHNPQHPPTVACILVLLFIFQETQL